MFATLYLYSSCFFFVAPPPPRSTLFPYTTLFRSSVISRPRPYHVVKVRNRTPVRRCVRLIHTRMLTSTMRSEEHTSELQSLTNLVCRLLLEKKKTKIKP